MTINHAIPGPNGMYVQGSPEDDTLKGTDANDVLDGGTGADLMEGGLGYDVYFVDETNDRVVDADFYGVVRTSVTYKLRGAVHEMELTGANRIEAFGSEYDDVIDATGNTEFSLLAGGAGNDVYRVGDFAKLIDNLNADNKTAIDTLELTTIATPAEVALLRVGDDLLVRGADMRQLALVKGHFSSWNDSKIDVIRFADGTVWNQADIAANIKAEPFTGAPNAGSALYAWHGQERTGDAGNDRLEGAAYTTLRGREGSDAYIHRVGSMTIDNFATDNASATDVLHLVGSDAARTVLLREGDDLQIQAAMGLVRVAGYFAAGDQRIDRIVVGDGTIWNQDDIVARTMLQPDGNVAYDKAVQRNWNDPYAPVVGGNGDDVLDGRGYQSRLEGGAGYDVYFVDDMNEQVFDADGRGEVRASTSYVLGTTIDTLRLVGNQSARGDGNDHDNMLDATGVTGNSILSGGRGNDTYRVGNGPVLIKNDAPDGNVTTDIVELAGINGPAGLEFVRQGMDLVIRRDVPGGGQPIVTIAEYFNPSMDRIDGIRFGDGSSWTRAELDAHIFETVAGTDWEDYLDASSDGAAEYGYGGNDRLRGTFGDDRLEGGAGDDMLIGSEGNDTFVYAHGDGQDRIANAVMDNGSTVDTLRLSDIHSSQVVLWRDAENLVVSVPDGRVTVEKYFSPEDHRIDRIVTKDGVTWNEADILARLSPPPAPDVPVDGPVNTIKGGEGTDIIRGTEKSDLIDGGTGNDLLYGDAGTDTYVIRRGDGFDAVSDVAGDHLRIDVLDAHAGEVYIGREKNDLVLQFGADGLRIEHYYTLALAATVTFADGGTWTDNRSDLPQPIAGGAGVDVLLGTWAGDVLQGGAGDDSLDGYSGDDLLDGGAGSDALRGGEGNDTYVVDSAGDVVVDVANGGFDTVYSSVGTALADDVETLVLIGIETIDGYGNKLANTIRGNARANLLDGGAGGDLLSGGAGDDTYIVDNAADIVDEIGDQGMDTVKTSVTYALADAVENLTLTGYAAVNGTGNGDDNVLVGNTAANVLTGGDGNDLLDGGVGADQMVGGTGNDTYVVDRTADMVVEGANEGSDTVRVSFTYTLGQNVENLTLTGTLAISGTGNALDNVLTGNTANNTLTGGDGNDTLDGNGGTDRLVGGNGNDTYTLRSISDVISEYVTATGGVDKVLADFSYTLGNGLEALTLTGSNAVNGTGNTVSNLLVGNGAANSLSGGGGNDLLQGAGGDDVLADSQGKALFDGGAGNDSLSGGAGAELYIGGKGIDKINVSTGADVILVNRGDGKDVVTAGAGQDNVLSLGGGIRYADLALQKSGNDLVVVLGANDQVTLTDWYAAASTAGYRSVSTLQVVIDGTADYVAGGDAWHNNKVEQFDFAGLASAFDAARGANPALTTWAVSASLGQYLKGGSDAAAFGGSLAWQYAHTGDLAGAGMANALEVLGASGFGTTAQVIGVGTPAAGDPLLV